MGISDSKGRPIGSAHEKFLEIGVLDGPLDNSEAQEAAAAEADAIRELAQQKYDEAYEKAIDDGDDEDEARRKAEEARDKALEALEGAEGAIDRETVITGGYIIIEHIESYPIYGD